MTRTEWQVWIDKKPGTSEVHIFATQGDANDLLHPMPWNDVQLRLVHDGEGMVTLHPDDLSTADFVRLRPVFFGALLRSIPTGQKLTPDTLRGIAASIAQTVADKWREVGRGCRVEVGAPPPIVIDIRIPAAPEREALCE